MTPAELSAIAERAKSGDAAALEALVRELQGPLYRVALRFLGEPEAARDATQEIAILVITHLSTFRGDSAVTTWAYRVAVRYLMRARQQGWRWTFESLADEDLGQPPNAVEPTTLAAADEKLLEEEVFVGCTQVMLQALDREQRIAFVLGAICDLGSAEAAEILDISEAAFRKRLSRARSTLDAFVGKHCGVADAKNVCRCRHQINHNVARGVLNPSHLRFASPAAKTSVEALRALGEIHAVRRSLELYRAQPDFAPPDVFAEKLRRLIASAPVLSGQG